MKFGKSLNSKLKFLKAVKSLESDERYGKAWKSRHFVVKNFDIVSVSAKTILTDLYNGILS